MPAETDIATAIATEVAKQIPVKDAYQDIAQPAARQVGKIAEDMAKTLRLVFAPLQVTAALQERLESFLDKSIKRVPDENRIPPAPQLLGPILEGIRYEPEDSPISDMFSQLLSSSMDKAQVHHAHPAFTQIIRHLSADEAILLRAMWSLHSSEGRGFRQQFTQELDARANRFHSTKMEIDEIPTSGLIFPESLELYGQHLYALGLTAFYDWRKQDPIFAPGANGRDAVQTGTRVYKEFRLTEFGFSFMAAVTGEGGS